MASTAKKSGPKDGPDIRDLNTSILEAFEKAGGSSKDEVPDEKIAAMAEKAGLDLTERGIGRLRWMYKVRSEVLKTPLGKEVFRAFVKNGGPRGISEEEIVALGKKHGQKLDAGTVHKLRWSLGMRVTKDLFPEEPKAQKAEAAPEPKKPKPPKVAKAPKPSVPKKAAKAKAEKPAKPAKKTKGKKEAGNGKAEPASSPTSSIDALLDQLEPVS